MVKFSDLSGNRLTGQIPDEIGDCSALQTLWVYTSIQQYKLKPNELIANKTNP